MRFASYTALFTTLFTTTLVHSAPVNEVNKLVDAPLGEAGILEARAPPTGRGTWFDVGLGACGDTNYNYQPIIAMNRPQWNKKKVCGKWITVKNAKNGKTVRGYVKDMCPGCSKWSLDMSPSMFKKLAPLSQGVVTITWAAPKKRRDIDTTAAPVVDDEGNEFDPKDEISWEDLEAEDDNAETETPAPAAATPASE